MKITEQGIVSDEPDEDASADERGARILRELKNILPEQQTKEPPETVKTETGIEGLVKKEGLLETLRQADVNAALVTRVNQYAEAIERTGVTIKGFEILDCTDEVPAELELALLQEMQAVAPEGVALERAVQRELEYDKDTTHFMFDEKKYFSEMMAGGGPIKEVGQQANINECMNAHELLLSTLRQIKNENPDLPAVEKSYDDALRRLQLLRYCSQVATLLNEGHGKVFDVGNIKECGEVDAGWINPRQFGYPYYRIIIEAGDREDGYLTDYEKNSRYWQAVRGYTKDGGNKEAGEKGRWSFPVPDSTRKIINSRTDVMAQVTALPQGDPTKPETVANNALTGYSRFSDIVPPSAVQMNMDAFCSEEKFKTDFEGFIKDLLSGDSPRKELLLAYASQAGLDNPDAGKDFPAIQKIYLQMPFDDRVRLHSSKWKAKIGAANGIELTSVGTLYAPDVENPGDFSTRSGSVYYSAEGVKDRIIASRTQILKGTQERLHREDGEALKEGEREKFDVPFYPERSDQSLMRRIEPAGILPFREKGLQRTATNLQSEISFVFNQFEKIYDRRDPDNEVNKDTYTSLTEKITERVGQKKEAVMRELSLPFIEDAITKISARITKLREGSENKSGIALLETKRDFLLERWSNINSGESDSWQAQAQARIEQSFDTLQKELLDDLPWEKRKAKFEGMFRVREAAITPPPDIGALRKKIGGIKDLTT